MDTLLARTTAEQRRDLFVATGERMGISAQLVEKDFWVCWILRRLFTLPELAGHLTFKGGTSLSKAFGIIERFSEDIDLIVERHWLGVPDEPDGSSLQWLKKVKQACRRKIREELIPMLAKDAADRLGAEPFELFTNQTSNEDPRVFFFRYPTVLSETPPGYVQPVVKMEFNARSDSEPAHEAMARPYVGIEFPDVLPVSETRLRCLAPERTFFEKATLLHEELLRPIALGVRPRLSRHYYDLAQMLQHRIGEHALADLALYERVVRHRALFFPNDWMGDYSAMLNGPLILKPADERLPEWRRDYEQMTVMFFREPPKFDDLLNAADTFAAKINTARGL
jgi:predicted nucleotidyltransferase component of viral defense system